MGPASYDMPLAAGLTMQRYSSILLQMWHWGEKRRLAQYYSELYAREKAEEDAYTDELRAKLRALEEELLA